MMWKICLHNGRAVRSGVGRRVAAWCVCLALVCLAMGAQGAAAMEVTRDGTKLIVTGTHFRYTWDTRRGGELAAVEQPGLALGGWWEKGTGRVDISGRPRRWQRVNSAFAWKSLDTIPALSFSTKRGSYYSGEWTIAYANADRNAELSILRQTPQEVVFETRSSPKILENWRLPVPWKVYQRVHVFDSGVVITTLRIELPENEVYELDWAQMGVNLDDSLYKEPHPDRQQRFVFGWAFPGKPVKFGREDPVLQDLDSLPMDIDIKTEKAIVTESPLLFGLAAWDLTHVTGAPFSGYMECALEEARPLVNGAENFGSHVMIRPGSGMSPVPTYAGSMRNNPSFGVTWNLHDGPTLGLNEPLTYTNTLTLAVGSRKRSSLPGAPADDRNTLLGARIYYARDKAPSADEVKAMADEGCDTLILGAWWRQDQSATASVVSAARAAGMRVGATVDVRELQALIADGKWFTDVFQPDRDGLLVTSAHCLSERLPQMQIELDGQTVSIRHDGASRVNSAGYALAMRSLRRIVGDRGFLIADSGGEDPRASLLSHAEFDLHVVPTITNAFRWGSPADQALYRHSGAAGSAPVVDSLGNDLAGLSVIHGDTPIVLYPPRDRKHVEWWQLCKRLPENGFRIESSLLPVERRFTVESATVRGSMYDGGEGQAVMLLTSADKPGSARVTVTAPVKAIRTLDGQEVAVSGDAESGFTFDAGDFAAWQIKGFVLTLEKSAWPDESLRQEAAK